MRCFLILMLAASGGRVLSAQSPDTSAPSTEEGFRVYTESPRLLLRPQRLRLLKRESERKSMRWENFQTLIAGGARMPEQGFAYALYAAVKEDAKSAKQAIDWAMQATGPVRQIAIVYDWCRPWLSPAQAKALEGKLLRATQAPARTTEAVRDRVFAAIALGDTAADVSERALRDVVQTWWRGGIARTLESGKPAIRREDGYALFEILHTVRDNLNIDLREDARDYFKPLPAYYLLSHYPASLAAPENEYRIPAYSSAGEPNLDAAALSRAAGLSMVAFDTNSTDSQFLQGWLMMDHYMMRGAFGVTYELLWANPYQPGLSYFHFPLGHHDPRSGWLFLRSSWEDDSDWFGIVDGQLQLFSGGKIVVLNPKLKQAPIDVGTSKLVIASDPLRFTLKSEDGGTAFVVGLSPHARYTVEVDDEEMYDAQADPAGTVAIALSAGFNAGIRLTPLR